MADTSLLPGLLDRAGRVFSMTGQLGWGWHDEHARQRERGQVDPSAWGRLRPDFDEFCKAVLTLQEEMLNPPDGFGPVAKALLEAARVAKKIRETIQRTDGITWAL